MSHYDRWKTNAPEGYEMPDEVSALIGRDLWIDGELVRIEEAEPEYDRVERETYWYLHARAIGYNRSNTYSLEDIQAFLANQINHGPLEERGGRSAMSDPLEGTQLQLWRQQELVPPAAEGERVITFVFRAAVGPSVDPDDIIQHGPETLFVDLRDVESGEYSVYIPEGSHWTVEDGSEARWDVPPHKGGSNART